MKKEVVSLGIPPLWLGERVFFLLPFYDEGKDKKYSCQKYETSPCLILDKKEQDSKS